MTIKETLRSNKHIFSVYVCIVDLFFRILTLISPELNTKARYRHAFKKKLNLENPQTFAEKLLTLKLKRYNSDPLVKKCADKYKVREYIKDCGAEHILIPLIKTYDTPDEIDFNALPDQFAIKWNYGCGYNIICPNKSKLDRKSTVKRLKKWSREHKYLDYSEMQYQGVDKKIIIEDYLKPSDGLLPADYKVYCFNGTPMTIFYINDRGTEEKNAAFFDLEWKFISHAGNASYKTMPSMPEKPACLNEMIEISRRLSAPFEFVRIDYYEIDGKLYFGEMTFTPATGLHASECKINGKTMGEILQL